MSQFKNYHILNIVKKKNQYKNIDNILKFKFHNWPIHSSSKINIRLVLMNSNLIVAT